MSTPAADMHPVQSIWRWVVGGIGLAIAVLVMAGQVDTASTLAASLVNNGVDFVEGSVSKIHWPTGDSVDLDLPRVSTTDGAAQ